MQPIMADRQNYEANYLNDPAAGTSEFQTSWIQYYEKEEGKDKYSFRDSDDKLKTYELGELDRVLIVDPATTGLTGMVVTGTTSDRQYKVLVLDEVQASFTTDELLNKIFAMAQRWKVRMIAVEDVLFSVLYQHILETEMIRRGLRYRVEGVKTRQQQKEDRVRALVPYMANGRLLLGKQMDGLRKMIERFPSAKDYHSLDALAHGISVWRRSAGSDLIDKRKSAMEYLRATRNPITGYSL